MADILIGNVKGPQGNTGATGATGAQGPAATISVGSTTTCPYGQAARVTNSGTTGAAVFDFVIPQGRPGEQVSKLDNLTLDALTVPVTNFPVPAVGDNGSTLFGKISKWFSDMTSKVNTIGMISTYTNSASVSIGVNGLTSVVSTDALPAGTYVIYGRFLAGGNSSSGTFAELNLYREQTESNIITSYPFAKYVTFAVPVEITTATRIFVRAKANGSAVTVFADAAINSLKVMRIK